MKQKTRTFRYYFSTFTFNDAYNLADYAIKKKTLTPMETFGVDGKKFWILARARLKKADLLKKGLQKVKEINETKNEKH